MLADLIDALVTDLNANAGLPTHQTWRGFAIPHVAPEDCPVLAVVAGPMRRRFRMAQSARNYYEHRPAVIVEWYELVNVPWLANPFQSTTVAQEMQDLSRPIINRFEALLDYMQGYASGVPNPSSMPALVGVVATYAQGVPEHSEKNVWRLRIELEIQKF